MRVLILHNHVVGGASADERDVLDQVETVQGELIALGHEVSAAGVTLDLGHTRRLLVDEPPDCVFNLVESLAGDERLIFAVPGLLESLRLPFTGASLQALLMTTNKLVAKRLLRQCGLPSPAWYEGEEGGDLVAGALGRRIIVKPIWDHGSKGLDEEDVVEAETPGQVAARLASHRGERFAEQYIAGRELNLSVLADRDGRPQVLPAAEIVFDGYAEGRPRVVGYRAKWEPHSFAYNHTVPTFDFVPEDEGLIDELADLAREAWRRFRLPGYARVDFRVDEQRRPWILESNANPCLSSDAGFAAALRRAGISFAEAISRIVDATLPPARTAPGRRVRRLGAR